MAEATLHIHVDAAAIIAAVQPQLDSMKDKLENPPSTVPPGYRCQNCWRDDGDHETTCSFKAGS